jgi:hypothetical protein
LAGVLAQLFEDLDPDRLRVSRPSKFVFLCGGVILTGKRLKAANLRDYICRTRPLRLKHEVILAEQATQLYRDTSYPDLISFEEDIARIAAIVLVTAESAGALAELGAFASNETIRPALRILLQERFDRAESFVRFGPVERIRKTDRARVGVFPWETHRDGSLIVKSASPHYREIKTFIRSQLDAVPISTTFTQLEAAQLFYVIYWVVYVSFAVSTGALERYVRLLIPAASEKETRNKIFCMQIAGWIEKIAYSGKDYYCTKYDEDPFHYAFKKGVANTDSFRRKMDLRLALEAAEALPKHVRNKATEIRDVMRKPGVKVT